MGSCCKLLGVRSCVLGISSWSSHNIPINLHQTLLSVLTREGKVPRHNCHPPRSRPGWEGGGEGPCRGGLPDPKALTQHSVWVLPAVPRPGWRGRSQLPAPSEPRPQIWSSCHCWRRQASKTQMALRLLRPRHTRDQRRLCPCRGPLSLSHRGGDGERVTAASRPRLTQCRVLARAGALQVTASSLFPRSPGHLPTGDWLQRESQDPPLTSLSAHSSLKSPLTVTPWQLVSSGRGPLQRRPMAEHY